MGFEYKHELSDALSKLLNSSSEVSGFRAVGGGSINMAYEFSFGGSKYFLKQNSKVEFPQMFKKEVMGLTVLSETNTLIIPQPVLETVFSNDQVLVMEYLEKTGPTAAYSEKLGSGLADLHKIKGKEFGFEEDNYIGSLSQSNKEHKDWEGFFTEERLAPLVKWAYDAKIMERKHLLSFENLYKKLNELFPEEQPSLLHGDLWGGNAMNTTKGPSVYDPAVYYGHREMDIAMTRLFGGFDENFYLAYNNSYPLEKNYRQRTDICNLYPLLVHVRLFGTSYLHEVLQTIKRF
jgi:protein-ribulosamine 3-kinase